MFFMLIINASEWSEFPCEKSHWMQEHVSNIAWTLLLKQNAELGQEIGQASISLHKENLLISWLSVSSSCCSVKCRVLCRMPRAQTERLQMGGRHCRGLAGSSSCPTPNLAPARVPGLHFRPGTASCSHPSLKQLVERTFCLPLSGVFLWVFP